MILLSGLRVANVSKIMARNMNIAGEEANSNQVNPEAQLHVPQDTKCYALEGTDARI